MDFNVAKFSVRRECDYVFLLDVRIKWTAFSLNATDSEHFNNSVWFIHKRIGKLIQG